mmetsp:Transcript_21041/g.46145  ORF Transcript_21041/g.46145 Transcript_21041/m.46145 type:complete len:356 (-) Transcript_21041:440-1507(-)
MLLPTLRALRLRTVALDDAGLVEGDEALLHEAVEDQPLCQVARPEGLRAAVVVVVGVPLQLGHLHAVDGDLVAQVEGDDHSGDAASGGVPPLQGAEGLPLRPLEALGHRRRHLPDVVHKVRAENVEPLAAVLGLALLVEVEGARGAHVPQHHLLRLAEVHPLGVDQAEVRPGAHELLQPLGGRAVEAEDHLVRVDRLARVLVVEQHPRVAHQRARPVAPLRHRVALRHQVQQLPFGLGDVAPGGGLAGEVDANLAGGALQPVDCHPDVLQEPVGLACRPRVLVKRVLLPPLAGGPRPEGGADAGAVGRLQPSSATRPRPRVVRHLLVFVGVIHARMGATTMMFRRCVIVQDVAGF